MCSIGATNRISTKKKIDIHFRVLRNLLMTLKRFHDREMEGNFGHIKEHLKSYGIGHLDEYSLMNEIARMFDGKYRDCGGEKRFDALPFREGIEIIPFLKKIYPGAKFIYIRKKNPVPVTKNKSDKTLFELCNAIKKYGNDIFEFDEEAIREDKENGANVILEFIGIKPHQPLAFQEIPSGGFPESRQCKRIRPRKVSLQRDKQIMDALKLNRLVSFKEERPIFLLGAGRSGTSAIVGALRKAQIPGWHEGHVYPYLEQLLKRLFLSWHNMTGDCEESGTLNVYDVLNAVIRSVHIQCKKVGSEVQWLDKTPDSTMIRCLPLLEALYPNSRYIFMRRHPISFALSRARKFNEPPWKSFREWISCIEAWETAKKVLDPEEYQEFDQKELTQSNEKVMDGLSKLLNLSGVAKAGVSDYLKTQRPEFTEGSLPEELFEDIATDDGRKYDRSLLYYRLFDLNETYIEDTNWDVRTREDFLARCGQKAKEYDYTLNRNSLSREGFLCDVVKQIETLQHSANERQKDIQYLSAELNNWKYAAEQKGKDIEYLSEQCNRWKKLCGQRTPGTS